MIQIDRGPISGAGWEKGRVLRARRLFADLAGRVPDRARARRLEAGLNDAWLCLQLARVAQDPGLELDREGAYASLLNEVLHAAPPKRRAALPER